MSRGASSAMKALHAGSIETAGKSALKVASSTALAADALRKTAATTVYRASKNIVFSQTHTHASMTAENVENTQTLPSCIAPTVIPQFLRRLSVTSAEPAELVFSILLAQACCPRMSFGL